MYELYHRLDFTQKINPRIVTQVQVLVQLDSLKMFRFFLVELPHQHGLTCVCLDMTRIVLIMKHLRRYDKPKVLCVRMGIVRLRVLDERVK